MKSSITGKEFNTAIENIPNILKESEQYIELINRKGFEIKKESISEISPKIIDAFNLSLATIILLVKGKSKILGNSNSKTSEGIILVASFVQGCQISKDLILCGQYIKASASLKQDFEFMARLKAVNAGTHKYGVPPHVDNAPKGLRFILAQANNIAHISKSDILKLYVGVETEQGIGCAPVPQLKSPQTSVFLLHLTAITFEILSEAIVLHKELYGLDPYYKTARIYHKYLIGIFKEIEKLSSP